MKHFATFALSLLAAAALIPLAAHAAASFESIVPLPGLSPEAYATLSFADYLKLLFKYSIAIGAMLAVLMFIYGGFQYMTSDAVSDKKKGVSHIRDAVTGLLLLLSVVMILQVINPCILEINILSPNQGACSQTAAPQGATQGTETSSQVEASRQGAYRTPDGSCITFAPTACISGNPPVIKCQNHDSSLSDRPTQGCGNLIETYVCEQSACGSAPVAVPNGAHLYTGDEFTCIDTSTHCPANFQNSCRDETKVCLFSGNRYSAYPNAGGCPAAAQPAYMCRDNITQTDSPQGGGPNPQDLTPLPSGSVVIARGATCPTDHPNPESICQYDNNYMLGDTCTPTTAAKTRCVRTCTDANDHNDCVAR